MLLRAPALCLLLVATGLVAATAAAHPSATVSALSAELTAAQPAAAELKSAHAAVDQALKVRKQKLETWQRAQKLRDTAAADVAKKKKAGVDGSALEASLKAALALDEDAAQSRSQLLAAESDVATRGAQLLKLYDGLLVDRRRAVEALPQQSSARAQAVSSYRDLAAQRDAVRQALLPVLPVGGETSAELPKGVDLDVRSDDDVETLLEKADLARDLEERFLREAEAVKKRIAELEDEQAMRKSVSSMVGRSQLFDEEDRRLPAVRTETTTTQQPAQDHSSARTPAAQSPAPPSGGNGFSAGDADGAGAEAPAPPPSAPSSAFAITQAPTVVHGEQAMAAPDTALAGMLSSPAVSVDSLKALEAKLKARAAELDAKQKKLKAQAQQR